MVDSHIVSDLRGLPDDNSGTVVYKEPPSDMGTRMNLYPCDEAIDVRQQASEKTNPLRPEHMGDTMEPDRMQPRVAADDFPDAPGRRIPVKNHPDIFSDPLKHLYPSG